MSSQITLSGIISPHWAPIYSSSVVSSGGGIALTDSSILKSVIFNLPNGLQVSFSVSELSLPENTQYSPEEIAEMLVKLVDILHYINTDSSLIKFLPDSNSEIVINKYYCKYSVSWCKNKKGIRFMDKFIELVQEKL